MRHALFESVQQDNGLAGAFQVDSGTHPAGFATKSSRTKNMLPVRCTAVSETIW
jgi:hypothetical protein